LLLVRTGFGRAAVKPGLPSRVVDAGTGTD